MRVTISHITAAYHWLMTTMDGRDLAARERHATLGSCPTKIRQLRYFDLDDYAVEDEKTDLLVTDSSACPAPQSFVYHTCQKGFPDGAFVALESGIQIVSPELSFWQMSKILPLGELIKYGDALCGKRSYTLDADGYMHKREVPLTTAKRLAAFVRAMGTPRNNRRAFTAVKYVVDNSESPMESCTTILLCLKRQYGGYGFMKPIMGYEVDLDEIGRKLAGTETCRCDMYWPGANYDLEYDSDLVHGPDAATKDSMRRSAIKHMGIRVGELRKPQVVDAETFKMSVPIIADELGMKKRWYTEEQRFKHELAYLDLRQQLFSWERAGGSMERSPLCIGDCDW